MICSNSEPLCLAGIYGGLNSVLNLQKHFLESAIFNSVTIRKSSETSAFAVFRYEEVDQIKLFMH